MDTSNINIERAHRDGENRTIKKVIVADFSFYKDEINISQDCKNFNRAYSSSLLRPIIARDHLLFPSIFKFCTFLRKFSNILPFLSFSNIFYPFSEKSHACLYFLE